MLKGKTVILGVTGSIAAYKIANLASMLMKQHCDVHVIMTKNATNFIHPVTFETLTNNRCLVDTFDRNFQYNVEHVSLAKRADLIMIAPATANMIAKLTYGMADDMLTTTVLACTCKKIIAPAMNTRMYQNKTVQENMKKLAGNGFEVLMPATGRLACGDIGEGKLPDESVLLAYIVKEIAYEKDMKGLHVMVTAGPTMEAIDPVRYITNHSTGKMGYAVARACMLRGARVTLITGQTTIEKPPFVEVVEVVSAREMFDAVTMYSGQQDIIVKAAAVADYRPCIISEEKIKKSDGSMTLQLEKTDDILRYLGEHKKPGQFLCGFSMETEHMLENSRVKLTKKNLDMIAANNLKEKGAGFGTDTNIITIITKDKDMNLEMMTKEAAANRILDMILTMRQE